MKYMLLMKFQVEGWESGNVTNWKPEDIQANMDFVRQFSQDLTTSGEFVTTQGLGGPEHIKMVKAGQGGAAAITDGPYPESKEFLAGLWIIDVDSPERAYEVAAKLSAIPGPGGQPANIPIEVRPVMHGCGDV